MRLPLCIDLFCGLGGWAEGFLSEGYEVIGFDIERHRYPELAVNLSEVKGGGGIDFNRHDSFNGTNEKRIREAPLTGGWSQYPGQLVIQDVLTLHGSQFKDADVIVASPPCQAYSFMAMPFSRGKQRAAAIRADKTGKMLAELNRLFDACFRIQREASVAAGRDIPLIVENVRGAQPWVGRSKYNYGSFHLWGDVPALMPKAKALKWGGCNGKRFDARPPNVAMHQERTGRKVPGMNFHDFEKTGKPGRSFQSAAVKVASEDGGRRTDIGKGARFTSRDCGIESQKQPVWFNDDKRRGDKCGGDWFGTGKDCSLMSSKSSARKRASAKIAKIPFELASHIARVYKPYARKYDSPLDFMHANGRF